MRYLCVFYCQIQIIILTCNRNSSTQKTMRIYVLCARKRKEVYKYISSPSIRMCNQNFLQTPKYSQNNPMHKIELKTTGRN